VDIRRLGEILLGQGKRLGRGRQSVGALVIWAGLGLWSGVTADDWDKVIEIAVTPRISVKIPTTIRIKLTIPVHEDNRLARVDILCEGTSVSASEIELNRTRRPPITFWMNRRLDEACDYEIVGHLYGVGDRYGSARTSVIVVGPGPTP
jgi:hypothetical protein